MGNPGCTPEQLQRAAEAYQQYGQKQAAADSLGLHVATFTNRLKRAAAAGYLGAQTVLPGYRISKSTDVVDENGQIQRQFIQQRPELGEEMEVPDGHRVKGISALVDSSGRTIQQWIKTAEGKPDILAAVEAIKEKFKDFTPQVPTIPAPTKCDKDKLTYYPFGDWHMGLHAWGKEAEQDWDLKIANKALRASVGDLYNAVPNSHTAIVLFGGDMLHSDNNENKTARSGNVLDVDGRYPKVLEVSCFLSADVVSMALQRHKRVIVRVLPGNHDEHSAVALAFFLKAYFRANDRVAIDTSPSLYFHHRFGLTLLFATHGHTVKPGDLSQLMAHRLAKDWGETSYRYAHTFHRHHKQQMVTEGGGVITEVHQAPVPQDAYHYGAGYISGRSICAITYHKEHGEVSRDTRTIRVE